MTYFTMNNLHYYIHVCYVLFACTPTTTRVQYVISTQIQSNDQNISSLAQDQIFLTIHSSLVYDHGGSWVSYISQKDIFRTYPEYLLN